MFIVSIKTNYPRLAVLCVALGLVVAFAFGMTRQDRPATRTGAAAPDRVAFLTELGYEVDPQWTGVREILIPAAFDKAFTVYNEIQQDAGYDLSAYRGRRVKCWTYTVHNYPDDAGVQANVYEYDGQVIGGDISSVQADGFCHGLLPLQQTSPDQKGETNGTTG